MNGQGRGWNEPTQIICRINGFDTPGMVARMRLRKQPPTSGERGWRSWWWSRKERDRIGG